MSERHIARRASCILIACVGSNSVTEKSANQPQRLRILEKQKSDTTTLYKNISPPSWSKLSVDDGLCFRLSVPRIREAIDTSCLSHSMSGPYVPPGQSPPFQVVDDLHHGAWIIITGALGLVVSLVSFFIRLYVRIALHPPFAYDDYLLLGATVSHLISILDTCSNKCCRNKDSSNRAGSAPIRRGITWFRDIHSSSGTKSSGQNPNSAFRLPPLLQPQAMPTSP